MCSINHAVRWHFIAACTCASKLFTMCFYDTFSSFGDFYQEEVQAESESDDEEQQIYNPLKLPMGWDGKPIPYWLYKLHGLGQVTIFGWI